MTSMRRSSFVSMMSTGKERRAIRVLRATCSRRACEPCTSCCRCRSTTAKRAIAHAGSDALGLSQQSTRAWPADRATSGTQSWSRSRLMRVWPQRCPFIYLGHILNFEHRGWEFKRDGKGQVNGVVCRIRHQRTCRPRHGGLSIMYAMRRDCHCTRLMLAFLFVAVIAHIFMFGSLESCVERCE